MFQSFRQYELAAFLELCDRADVGTGQNAFVSKRKLAGLLGCDPKTAKRTLGRLEELHAIRLTGERRVQGGGIAVYAITGIGSEENRGHGATGSNRGHDAPGSAENRGHDAPGSAENRGHDAPRTGGMVPENRGHGAARPKNRTGPKSSSKGREAAASLSRCFSEADAAALVAEHGPEAVLAAVGLLERRSEKRAIVNPAGFIRSALEGGWADGPEPELSFWIDVATQHRGAQVRANGDTYRVDVANGQIVLTGFLTGHQKPLRTVEECELWLRSLVSL